MSFLGINRGSTVTRTENENVHYNNVTVGGTLVATNIRVTGAYDAQVQKEPKTDFDPVNKRYLDALARGFMPLPATTTHATQLTSQLYLSGYNFKEKILVPTPIQLGGGGAEITGVSKFAADSIVCSTSAELHNPVLVGDARVYGTLMIPEPTGDDDAATKRYVDLMARGLSPKMAVRLATTAPLGQVVYSLGNCGVGGSIVPVHGTKLETIDSEPLQVWDRILVKNEPEAIFNGVYIVASDHPGVLYLVRALDASHDSLILRSYYYVEAGKKNKHMCWVNVNHTLTIGLDPIVYSPFCAVGLPSIENLGDGAALFRGASGRGLKVRTLKSGADQTISVRENLATVVFDVNQSNLDLNRQVGPLRLDKGGTGLVGIPPGHILVGGAEPDRVGTLELPAGELVGTSGAQKLENKCFEQIVLVGRQNATSTILPPDEEYTSTTHWLPSQTDTLVGEATSQVLTNKKITRENRMVVASHLKCAVGEVDIVSAAPRPGQILTALTPTTAAWSHPDASRLLSATSGNAGTASTTTGGGATTTTSFMSAYITGKAVDLKKSSWTQISRSLRGAGQVILSCDAHDDAPQLIANVAKASARKGDMKCNITCETEPGKLKLRWKPNRGLEARGFTASYQVCLIGLL